MKEQKNIYKIRCYNIDYTPDDDYEGDLKDYGPKEAIVEVEATPDERADDYTFECLITQVLMYETGCWFENYDYEVLPEDREEPFECCCDCTSCDHADKCSENGRYDFYGEDTFEGGGDLQTDLLAEQQEQM